MSLKKYSVNSNWLSNCFHSDSVKDALSQSQQDFAKLYAEVAFQSADNLCDGLNRLEEEKHCNVFSQIHPIRYAHDTAWKNHIFLIVPSFTAISQANQVISC